MKLYRASAADSDKLKEFYQTFQLSGPVQMEVTRGDNFFSFYKSLGDGFRSYILEDEESIQGLASFIIFDRVIAGEKVPIAYALDFRLKKSRAAILEWSRHFQPILEEMHEQTGCRHFFTSLHRNQAEAYNAFIRPRHSRRGLPRYHMFRNFRLVSVHGRLPLSPAPLTSLTYRRATENDREALTEYFQQHSSSRPIQIDWKNGGFEQSLRSWPGLKLEDFVLALNAKGKIVGSAAPWNLHDLKDFIPLTYSARADNFRQILKIASWLRFARPLPKPIWKNPANQAFKFEILTHLRAEHEDILDSLLTHIWQQTPKDHFLVYSHFDGEYWLRPSLNFITTSQKFTLYNITPVGSSLPEVLTPIDESPPDLEIAPLVY